MSSEQPNPTPASDRGQPSRFGVHRFGGQYVDGSQAALGVALTRGQAVLRQRALGRSDAETADLLGFPVTWIARYGLLAQARDEQPGVFLTPDGWPMTLVQAEITLGVRCPEGFLRPGFGTPEEVAAELLERRAAETAMARRLVEGVAR